MHRLVVLETIIESHIIFVKENKKITQHTNMSAMQRQHFDPSYRGRSTFRHRSKYMICYTFSE